MGKALRLELAKIYKAASEAEQKEDPIKSYLAYYEEFKDELVIKPIKARIKKKNGKRSSNN